jgi:hypothetical protein
VLIIAHSVSIAGVGTVFNVKSEIKNYKIMAGAEKLQSKKKKK